MDNDTATLTPPAPAPTVPTEYMCSDCVTPTRATEVHELIADDVVAYCARCAHTFRRYARRVYPAASARARGITLTL